ncbi:DUF1934 domain-containing protein [Virgibacillus halodenitrificans]|uniref:DUF1934 domain-containing protein n=1 Tax=Virgibacillus halodenitrificans TaxID=1482 RepID=UPI00045CC3B9|nr:DUF1934 domain-containing protein [Virgibacillus halodenitrificans]CDQ32198.1 putative beta-barrel protein YwiB [Virgibacillus halodenitrificans]CDQ37739.1 putative beta-barrel protein YwiB [Virgibacillus halodenitrificans]
MNALHKNVSIELQTMIEEDGAKESNKQKHTGKYYKRNNLDVLTYEETSDDKSVIHNLITIQQNKVSIKRSGNVRMNQQFREGQITENVFYHPHGGIHMETYTETIHYQSNEESGSLTIDYKVKLNGQEERNQEIKLSFKEEESQ